MTEGGETPKIRVASKHHTMETIKKIAQKADAPPAEAGSGQKEGEASEDVLARAFQRGVSGAFAESRLSEDKQYREFQKTERWCNTKYEINKDMPPLYWVKVDDDKKLEIELRAELIRAVNEKREKGFTLEDLSANPELMGITKSETQALYSLPGVHQGMVEYVALTYKDQGELLTLVRDGRRMSLMECSDRKDVEMFRDYVEEKLRFYFANNYEDWDEDRVRLMARDAEQVAFNLLYVGNYFESMDAQWEDLGGGKYRSVKRPSLYASELLAVPIKLALNPLDALIDTHRKEPGEAKRLGGFGSWAYENIRRAVARSGAEGIDEIVVLPFGKGEARWWQVETYKQGDKDKTRIYVPDCYPVKPVASIWEETRITDPDDKKQKSLLWYLRHNKEIPWDVPEAANLWADYLSKLRNYSEVWKFYQGDDPNKTVNAAKFGGYGGAKEALTIWAESLLKNLRSLRWGADENKKRWILYASMGVKSGERMPTLVMKEGDRWSVGKILTDPTQGVQYLDSRNLFFPWDRTGSFASFK